MFIINSVIFNVTLNNHRLQVNFLIFRGQNQWNVANRQGLHSSLPSWSAHVAFFRLYLQAFVPFGVSYLFSDQIEHVKNANWAEAKVLCAAHESSAGRVELITEQISAASDLKFIQYNFTTRKKEMTSVVTNILKMKTEQSHLNNI